MSQQKAEVAAKRIRASMPGDLAHLIEYISELQDSADEKCRRAIENTLLRQNQGKSQLCEELLKILNT